MTEPLVAKVDLAAPNPTLFRRLIRDPLGASALGFLTLVVLAAIFAPLLARNDPNLAVLANILASPSSAHPLGGDSSGRDVLARLLFGARFSLLGALVAVSVSVVFGALTGLIAGYFGSWFDSLANWVASILMALPAMVVLLAARSVIGTSAWWAMTIFGILLSAAVFRLVRATVQSVRNELYVDAARVAGLSDIRIIFRHVLRVVRAPVIIQIAGIASVSIAIQAGLEFLGLGDMTIPSWGAMLNDGFGKLYVQPLLVIWPSLMIALVCLAFTLIANSLRDALEGTTATKRRRKETVGAEETKQMPLGAAATLGDGTDVLLAVRDLKIGYHSPRGTTEVVHGVSLDVRRGEVLGLIGESGSGKTQTAFAIMRLLAEGGSITNGSVSWKGRDLAHLSAKEMTRLRGRSIAYIPQEPMSNLDPTFTIGHQLIEPLRVTLGLSKADATARALELLARVGIPDPPRTLRSYPHEVSGGMAQRVLIAGAISCEPDLLIADEPTTALDVTVQAEILELLRSLQADLGMGMILVTHNFGVVADLADRVAVMQEGMIVEAGEVRDVFRGQKHEYTRSLFAAILSDEQIRPSYEPPAGSVAVEVSR
jgi:ABC-type dipeptide/oligopeptide/nickel transport system ATPase component/ABC-type dipeptide/oligopeptide/nickel transport system permease subunit